MAPSYRAGIIMQRRLPKALKKGDEVAVIAPASGGFLPDALARGCARLREWGFEPTLLPHARERLDWPEGCTMAAPDEARLADLQQALDEPRFRAVLCTRGGYGVGRLLPQLDWTAFAGDPKPIVGYSDLTALHAAARVATGVVTLHGPMVATTDAMDPGAHGWELQRRLLTETRAPVELPAAVDSQVLSAGAAEGPLVGGNLALVQSLLGTPWQLDMRGALVFLEDIGEAPYRVDRMLTQLLQAGALRDCAGIVLGDFHADDTPLASVHPGMQAVLVERLQGAGVPVACGFPIGHRPGAWTLPFGAMARLHARADGPAMLALLEPAVQS